MVSTRNSLELTANTHFWHLHQHAKPVVRMQPSFYLQCNHDSSSEVVDVQAIVGLIGRIKLKGHWYIIYCSDDSARPLFADDNNV